MACSSWHKFISNKRYFLDQRPLSLSEPLLSTLKVEHLHPPRECFSSPLVEGVFDLETTSIVEGSELSEEQNNYSFLCDADLFGTFKSITSKTLGNKELLKWVFVVLNVLVEVCQAAISEEKNEVSCNMKTIDESAIHHDQGFEDLKKESLHGKRSFLKKRIHSLSDPGLPQLKAENRPPKIPSPLPEGGSEVEEKPIIKEQDIQEVEEQKSHQGNNIINNSPATGFLVSNNLLFGRIIRTIRSNTLRIKVVFKWVLIVLNIIVEVCQATISQERNEGKMGRLTYLRLSIITSCICLTMALVEAFYEVQKYGVVWQKRGCCCWLHTAGDQGRLFGSFSLYFGLISSVIQLIINVAENLAIKRNAVQFDYIPLLLAVCYMLAAMVGYREKKSATPIRCSVHPDVEGTLIEDHERRLFQCPQCKIDVN